MTNNTNAQLSKQKQEHLHGAALIDDTGHETPITEEMIQKSLKRLFEANNPLDPIKHND